MKSPLTRPRILLACLLAAAQPLPAAEDPAVDPAVDPAALARQILADRSLRDVYQMALEVNEPPRLSEAFVTFCKFQGADGNIVDVDSLDGRILVNKYQAVFTAPPKKLPSPCSTDAPLLGNGDLLAALGGWPDKLCFHIGKADLWELRTEGGPRPLARLYLDLPALQGATCRVTQDLRQAITTGVFQQGATTLTVESAVAATANVLWLKLSAHGGTFEGQARLVLPTGAAATTEAGVQVVERRFDNDMFRPAGAACAVRILGSQDNHIAVTPEHPVYLVVTASGLANLAAIGPMPSGALRRRRQHRLRRCGRRIRNGGTTSGASRTWRFPINC